VRTFIRLSSAVIVLLLGGCNHHVYSPPARTLPLETIGSVGHGRTGLALEGARHGALFGVHAATGTARFRHGVSDDVDLSLEGNLIHIEGESAAGTMQEIYSLRIGTKYQVTSAFAVTGGNGLGLHAGGTFASPDLGVITGFENRYAVPFFSARALMSVPVRSHTVDTTSAGSPPGTELGRAELTGGFATAFGLRVPIPPSFEPKTGVRGSLVGGGGVTLLADSEDDTMLMSWGAGAEMEF
jgi:hypothetical protein